MKISDIEPGCILKGKNGQTCEVVSIDRGTLLLTYRMLNRGVNGGHGCPKTGTLVNCDLKHFAIWAQADVTEQPVTIADWLYAAPKRGVA